MRNHSNVNKHLKAIIAAALVICIMFMLPACTIKRGELPGDTAKSAKPSESVSSSVKPSPSPSPTPTPSPTPEPKKVLTVTEVGMDMNSGLSGVKAKDENGKQVELSGNPAEWFDGGSTFQITLPKGSSMLITADGTFALAEDSSLEVSVVINGASQSFTLKVGSTFDYTLGASGDIRLLLGATDVAAVPSAAPAGDPQSGQILTVKFVRLEDMTTVDTVTCTDENGKEVVLSGNWNDWFDNASVDGLELLDKNGGNGSIHMDMADAEKPYSLGDGSYFKVTATIDGKKYTFDVGVGSTFEYKTTSDDSIKLVVNDAFTPVS